ncbi:MAG: type II toxin-antitoxin system RelE/ParE family toxin [Lentisphaerae bacterium]|nr:type II toxin-antitoxin system RelE/ParE family toxin [Lentisphaerota bacterium]
MGQELAYKIDWARPGLRDLDDLLSYIARDNPAVAERFGRAILDRIGHLSTHPMLGAIVPERNNPAIRQIIHAPFRIIYRIHEGKRLLQIMRIWHGARGEPEI